MRCLSLQSNESIVTILGDCFDGEAVTVRRGWVKKKSKKLLQWNICLTQNRTLYGVIGSVNIEVNSKID